jgi:hypothetical protein
MRIPGSLKAHVLKEFDFVINKMREPTPLDERFYYYSALYGCIYHVMNLECAPDLVFLHHVLNTVHTAFMTRVQAISRGAEKPVSIDDQMLTRLIELTQELAARIRSDADSTDVCKSLINLVYATTGNGYYLLQKGELVP